MEGGKDKDENDQEENAESRSEVESGSMPRPEQRPESMVQSSSIVSKQDRPSADTTKIEPSKASSIAQPDSESKTSIKTYKVDVASKTVTPQKSSKRSTASSFVNNQSGPAFGEIEELKDVEKLLSDEKNVSFKTGHISSDHANVAAFPTCIGDYTTSLFLQKRNPFIHDPPQPEERRPRFVHPRTPREYIINLREDLADFQESHGLPRTRDYSFLSLGLALAQETARAIYSIILMFTELFPILAIVSLILRFALDKLIDILETPEPVDKIKKSLVFAVEMIVIVIPLWILIGSIVIPLISLIFSMFAKMLRLKQGNEKRIPFINRICTHLSIQSVREMEITKSWNNVYFTISYRKKEMSGEGVYAIENDDKSNRAAFLLILGNFVLFRKMVPSPIGFYSLHS